MSDSIVIIPTYNEKENIEKIIRAVLALGQPTINPADGSQLPADHQFNILVIDDGSPDGTAQIVKRLMAEEFSDRLFIIERSGKLGLGTAYITGFKWALEHQYDYIFEMDADFSHDPNDLPRLYSACHDEG
jgi:dolichol-phosphate mannosyltransferase